MSVQINAFQAIPKFKISTLRLLLNSFKKDVSVQINIFSAA